MAQLGRETGGGETGILQMSVDLLTRDYPGGGVVGMRVTRKRKYAGRALSKTERVTGRISRRPAGTSFCIAHRIHAGAARRSMGESTFTVHARQEKEGYASLTIAGTKLPKQGELAQRRSEGGISLLKQQGRGPSSTSRGTLRPVPEGGVDRASSEFDANRDKIRGGGCLP